MAIGTKTIALLALGLGLSACEKDRECERERLALAKNFNEVRLTAADAKKIDRDRAEKMGSAAQKEHADRWAKLETQAGLLQSAVITEQITWDSAEQAFRKAKAEYDRGEAVSAFEQGFGEALKQAEAAFGSFKNKCR